MCQRIRDHIHVFHPHFLVASCTSRARLVILYWRGILLLGQFSSTRLALLTLCPHSPQAYFTHISLLCYAHLPSPQFPPYHQKSARRSGSHSYNFWLRVFLSFFEESRVFEDREWCERFVGGENGRFYFYMGRCRDLIGGFLRTWAERRLLDC